MGRASRKFSMRHLPRRLLSLLQSNQIGDSTIMERMAKQSRMSLLIMEQHQVATK